MKEVLIINTIMIAVNTLVIFIASKIIEGRNRHDY
jgi:hypothetical protein